jgi:ElaB/YqjD/DUF883 family membrane-anchored ribosome-binding protein
MSTQFDVYQKMLNHERFQTGLMVGQTALMGSMAGSLTHLQGEMANIRQMNLEGLAIQQEMLQRQQLQAQLEEFIYNAQKLVTEFSDGTCDQPASARYFSLKGITETVQQLGIGTALIQGRENKAAFEAAMKDVQSLTASLENEPDVVEAISWSKSEQKRTAAENQLKEAKRAKIRQKATELQASRKRITFTDWYQHKFHKYLNKEAPFDNLPILKNLDGELYKFVATIALWGPLPIGVVYGCIWIPLWYALTKTKFEQELNTAIEGEIAILEKQFEAVQ